MKHILVAITLMSIVACNSSESSRSTATDPDAFKKGKATLSIAGKDVDEVVYFGIGTNDTGVTCLEHKSIQHSEIQFLLYAKVLTPQFSIITLLVYL